MKANYSTSLLLSFAIVIVQQGFARSSCDDVFDDEIIIPLENYNGWNLPFAQSVDVSSADSSEMFPIG